MSRDFRTRLKHFANPIRNYWRNICNIIFTSNTNLKFGQNLSILFQGKSRLNYLGTKKGALIQSFFRGLSKKTTCLRGLEAVQPHGQNLFRLHVYPCLWRRPPAKIFFCWKNVGVSKKLSLNKYLMNKILNILNLNLNLLSISHFIKK